MPRCRPQAGCFELERKGSPATETSIVARAVDERRGEVGVAEHRDAVEGRAPPQHHQQIVGVTSQRGVGLGVITGDDVPPPSSGRTVHSPSASVQCRCTLPASGAVSAAASGKKNSRNSSIPSAASSAVEYGARDRRRARRRRGGRPSRGPSAASPRQRRAAASTSTPPSPGRCRTARGAARRRARWRTWHGGERLVDGQSGARPLRVRRSGRLGRPLANDPAPEVVHLADVPDEVGGRPLRAARHGRLRIGAAGRREQSGRLVVQRGEEAGCDPSP